MVGMIIFLFLLMEYPPMAQDFQQPAPPPRSSGGSVWKWVAIGCGGAAVLAIALFGIGTFFVVRNLGLSMNPAEVEEKAQNLLQYSIPGGSKGVMSMNIVGVDLMQVSSLDEPPTVMLTIASLPPAFHSEQEREGFLEGFRESYPGTNNQTVTFSSERVESRTLCGQPVSLEIAEGEAVPFGNSTPRPAVSYATVVDHNNQVLLTWIVATGEQAVDNAEAVFNSFECRS
jgi:hypothetical protein